jgi:hypothetical protein
MALEPGIVIAVVTVLLLSFGLLSFELFGHASYHEQRWRLRYGLEEIDDDRETEE